MTDKGIRPYVCSVCGAPGYAKGLCERDLGRGRLAGTRHETAEHDLETLAKRARDLITEKAPWWTADDLSVRLGGTDAAFIAAASPDVVLGLLDRLAHMTEARDNARAEVLRQKADAWDEGHRTPWKREPDDCRCGAYSSGECGCGLYGTGRLITPNPYRATPPTTTEETTHE